MATRFTARMLVGGALAAVALALGFAADVSAQIPGKIERPAWMQKRPKPDDLNFFAVKTQLADYIKTVPEKEQDAEKERIRILSTLHDYLIKLLKAPYDGEVKLKGHTFKGSILCNENELDIKPRGSRKFKRIKWEDVPVDQYITFFDYYMNLRLKQEDAQLKGKAGEEKRKKEASLDAFNTALLADWYNEDEAARKYTKAAVEMNPELKSKAQQLLALYLDKKDQDSGAVAPAPARKSAPKEEEPKTAAKPESASAAPVPSAPKVADEPPGGTAGSLKVTHWKATGDTVEVNLLVTCQPNTPFNLSLWAGETEIRKFGFEVTGDELPAGADTFKPFTSAKHGQRLMPVALKNAQMKLTFPLAQPGGPYHLQINDQKLPLPK